MQECKARSCKNEIDEDCLIHLLNLESSSNLIYKDWRIVSENQHTFLLYQSLQVTLTR